MGEGILTLYGIEINKLPVLNVDTLKKLWNTKYLTKLSMRDSESIFIECGIDKNKPIREQTPKPLPNRAELDKIVFDELLSTFRFTK